MSTLPLIAIAVDLPPRFDHAFMNDSNAPLLASIEEKLCEIGNLISGQFPMTRRDLIRGGKNVGSYFCVHGPRSVKLTAIHDVRQNQIIFYGSDGVRRVAEPVNCLVDRT